MQLARVPAVPQQVRQPFGVLDVGLVPRHRLPMLGIDQDDRVVGLQQVEDRAPVHARALHGHLLHPAGVEPVIQRQQVRRHGAKAVHLAVDRPVRLRLQDASDHRLLMPIQSACLAHVRLAWPALLTAQRRHDAPSKASRGTWTTNTFPRRALRRMSGGATVISSGHARVSLLTGSGGHRFDGDLTPPASSAQ